MFRGYAEGLLRYKGWFLVGYLLLLVGSLWLLPQLKIDFAVGSVGKPPQHIEHQIRQHHQSYPTTGVDFVCAWEWVRPVSVKDLQRFRLLQRRLKRSFPSISVRSMADLEVVETGRAFPILRPFITLAEQSSVSIEAQRHPLVHGRLISHNLRSLVMYFDTRQPTTKKRLAYYTAMEKMIRAHSLGQASLYLFSPVLQGQVLSKYLQQDLRKSLLYLLLGLLPVLFFLFRTWRSVLLLVITLLCGLVLFCGVLVLLDRSLGVLGIALPGLLVIIALCDALHLLHRYEEALAQGEESDHAVVTMLEQVGPACFTTSLTTGLAFLSLFFAPHSSLKVFAVNAVLAVSIAFLSTLVCLPLLVAYWPSRAVSRRSWVRFRQFNYRRPLLALGLGLLFVGLCAGVFHLRMESYTLDELPSSSPLVKSYRWFERHFDGLSTLEVEVEGPLQQWKVFKALETFQQTMRQQPGVNNIHGYTSWVRELERQPKRLNEEHVRDAFQLLSFALVQFPQDVLQRNFRKARFRLYLRDIGSLRRESLKQTILQAAKQLPPNLKLTIVDPWSKNSQTLLHTLLVSLLMSFLWIGMVIVVVYRSVRLGVIAMLPNLLPILVALGVSGWLGIHVRLGVVVVYSLGLGLAVDDTIHILTRWVQEKAQNPHLSTQNVISRTLQGIGGTLVVSSILIGVFVLCYVPSSFQALRDIGILLSTIAFSALLVDLYLFPLVLEWCFSEEG